MFSKAFQAAAPQQNPNINEHALTWKRDPFENMLPAQGKLHVYTFAAATRSEPQKLKMSP